MLCYYLTRNWVVIYKGNLFHLLFPLKLWYERLFLNKFILCRIVKFRNMLFSWMIIIVLTFYNFVVLNSPCIKVLFYLTQSNIRPNFYLGLVATNVCNRWIMCDKSFRNSQITKIFSHFFDEKNISLIVLQLKFVLCFYSCMCRWLNWFCVVHTMVTSAINMRKLILEFKIIRT